MYMIHDGLGAGWPEGQGPWGSGSRAERSKACAASDSS